MLKSQLIHELSVLIGRSRRQSGRSRLRQSVVFLAYWSCWHLEILQIDIIADAADQSQSSAINELNQWYSHTHTRTDYMCTRTFVMSTGSPPLAAVIMWSRPLAFLRCCAAPCMSFISLERKAAFTNCCLRTVRKSNCCWAAKHQALHTLDTQNAKLHHQLVK